MTWRSTSESPGSCESNARLHGASADVWSSTPCPLITDVGHADLFGVYFRPSAAVYLLPIHAVAATEGRLRLEPTRNNQKLGIRFAADYEIDRWSIESLRGLVSHEGSGVEQLAFA